MHRILHGRSSDGALQQGQRGLPGDTSLPRLLQKHRDYRNPMGLPPLTVKQILQWADDHFAKVGEWPGERTGPVLSEPTERWDRIQWALQEGSRGLSGGMTIARLLAERRNIRNPKSEVPPLNVSQIARWAKQYHKRNGRWPTRTSGVIQGTNGESWSAVDNALKTGNRGFPGGSSLAKLLRDRFGVRNVRDLPELSERQILAWADAHFERLGRWPGSSSGIIEGAFGETWASVSSAPKRGTRGLSGGKTITQLLTEKRGVRNPKGLRTLNVEQILRWADDYFAEHGDWPRFKSGEIPGTNRENWSAVNSALVRGTRGLKKSSLAKLLAKHRGVRPKSRRMGSPLSESDILKWAKEHRRRTGRWPSKAGGKVIGSRVHLTWAVIDNALNSGLRGLPGGSTLSVFLAKYRDK